MVERLADVLKTKLGAAVIVMVALFEVKPLAVAWTSDVPAATPVTTPEVLTVATLGVAEVQVGVVQPWVGPADIVAVQVRAQEAAPICSEQLVGAMAIETTVAADTVIVELLVELNPLDEAVISEVPAATPVTTPVDELTVAFAGVAEVKTGVGHASVVESDMVAVQAIVQVVAPIAVVQDVGDTAMLDTVIADPD